MIKRMQKIDQLAKYLDFANHKAVSTKKEIKDLCEGVKKYAFNAVFVNPCWVKTAKKFLNSQGKVGTVVSFPLGQETTSIKIESVLEAIKNGALEVDVSANVGLLKSKRYTEYLNEMRKIVSLAKKNKADIIVKFIIEAYFLNRREIEKSAVLVLKSGADFVKTTSGFGPRDAKIEYVRIIKKVVGNKIKIKAAGGISTRTSVKNYLAAGATRIGTSKAIEIIMEP